MAAPGAAAQLPASSIPTGLSVDEEVKEYQKILKISDEVFSGTHPRLKVPQQFVRKPAYRDTLNPSPSKTQVPKTSPYGKEPERHLESIAKGKQSARISPSAKTPSAPTAPKPPSGIDPIFLTKSEELVRAELQLQRGRVERTLREQIDQRRQESKQKVALQDARPEFDVSEVLNRALELVRPSPSSETHGPAKAPSDSFDENSFYSSRAPDSPPALNRRPSPRPTHRDNLAADAPVGHYTDELQRLEALNNSGSEQEMQGTYPVAGQPLPSRKPPYNAHEDFANAKFTGSHQQADAFEEPDYSPPAPGVPPMERTDSREYQSGFASGPSRPEYQYQLPDRGRYGRGPGSPPGDGRIVRNHITSPAAPRPSRVSPLATAKVPAAHRFKEQQSVYGPDRARAGQDIGRGSPEVQAPAQRLMPRKRRRLHEEGDGSRRVSSRRQAVEPSEPFIKQEPVSPPPFADDLPPARTRALQERPIYIDIASPRYTPVIERREPVYEIDPYDIPGDPGASRAASRLSVRRPVREDQDLRRVASLHYARQPEYAREYVNPPQQPYTVERAPQEKIRYYDEPAVSYARRYVPVDEPISPNYRDAYYEEDVSPRVMAPPQRRIVVDEQGRQYYDMLPTPKMQPMPAPYTRVQRGDIYDEPALSRQPSIRAASIVEDPYSGRRYMQEMPPPPRTAYRRVTDYPRPMPSELQSYPAPHEGREQLPRSSSVQVGEYPARRAAYIDDPEPLRERIIRVSSVRPPTTRYEEPREMAQHMESVRPRSRAMSTYVDDARQQREYIERPVYVDARPAREERYYDGDGSAVFMRT